jgi:hypothetical protein
MVGKISNGAISVLFKNMIRKLEVEKTTTEIFERFVVDMRSLEGSGEAKGIIDKKDSYDRRFSNSLLKMKQRSDSCWKFYVGTLIKQTDQKSKEVGYCDISVDTSEVDIMCRGQYLSSKVTEKSRQVLVGCIESKGETAVNQGLINSLENICDGGLFYRKMLMKENQSEYAYVITNEGNEIRRIVTSGLFDGMCSGSPYSWRNCNLIEFLPNEI